MVAMVTVFKMKLIKMIDMSPSDDNLTTFFSSISKYGSIVFFPYIPSSNNVKKNRKGKKLLAIHFTQC